MSGKKRHSSRKPVNDDLDLGYPLATLRTVEATRNKEVFLHLYHFLRNDARNDLPAAIRWTRDSVKASWKGAKVELACDPTIEKWIKELHKWFKYVPIRNNLSYGGKIRWQLLVYLSFYYFSPTLCHMIIRCVIKSCFHF
jgi:hypothetical protein